MPELNEHVEAIESVLKTQVDNKYWRDLVQQKVKHALQLIAKLSENSNQSLAETIRDGVTRCPNREKRLLAVALVRLMGVSNLFTEHDIQYFRKELVSFIEEQCSDLTKGLFEASALNHEKIDAIERIHQNACASLAPLAQSFVSLRDLAERRQNIMRSINGNTFKGYLGAFGYKSIAASIESLLAQVATVVSVHGHTLQTTIQRLLEDIPIQIENCQSIESFVSIEFAVPFLEHLHQCAREEKEQMTAEFECEIRHSIGAVEGEKGYPLHLIGESVNVHLPLVNSGPGVAQNVTSYCVAEACEVQNPDTRLGNVEPGPFVLPLRIKLTEATAELTPIVEVKWNVVGDPEVHSLTFYPRIRGQRTDINWERLAQRQPYNLEVAFDNDFYGRSDVLNRITRHLTSNAMQSCYVSGQKRVGKSSLARAVQSRLDQIEAAESYHVLYLESGEFVHATGEQTLDQLGRQLELYFSSHLTQQSDWVQQVYSASLSHLNRLLELLSKENRSNRFVVILDEFDEINETLYSHGELANTFFLNLRTLASKRNLAFVLVGAERMPYLMSSQGEKLNRFEPELLDSFDQETEWSDFTSLVRNPVAESIVIHESALRRVYDLTDGHPYFTKKLCAEVYELALKFKDAEISDKDVEDAAQRLLLSFDVNAFAHYWRDGTRGDKDAIEIAAVKRCRTLVSWARTVRAGDESTQDKIGHNLYGGLRVEEMVRELDDFCRRGVFKEDGGKYVPTVELFGRWLQDGGFALLVDGHLGDELEEKRQEVEDTAYIQSNEVVELVSKWPLYRGNALTEDRIRAWVNQVESNVERRLLFKLLENLRFVSEPQVNEAFENVYRRIVDRLPVFTQRKRSQRRGDILVTFMDGAAKSGAQYASQFAKSNFILQRNVVPPERLSSTFKKAAKEGHDIAAVIIVDDMLGTGNSLKENMETHDTVMKNLEIGLSVPLFLCVFCATVEGESKVRNYLNRAFNDSDLYVYETLDDSHYAFGDDLGFWDSTSQKSKAKSLLTDLGVKVDRKRPFGYSDQGLLLTFYRNCPNNSLPILHGNGRGASSWNPIFPRT